MYSHIIIEVVINYNYCIMNVIFNSMSMQASRSKSNRRDNVTSTHHRSSNNLLLNYILMMALFRPTTYLPPRRDLRAYIWNDFGVFGSRENQNNGHFQKESNDVA